MDKKFGMLSRTCSLLVTRQYVCGSVPDNSRVTVCVCVSNTMQNIMLLNVEK